MSVCCGIMILVVPDTNDIVNPSVGLGLMNVTVGCYGNVIYTRSITIERVYITYLLNRAI